ncbi:MAG TPA: LuxR family transcriptional regulator [Jatrophihabitans sp.]|jgi:DNA-binding CsgD family transcriptional regulator|uniref:helix-turn-helix transcriptional regulator n=1 Tax=Jatrophihabitans sp. TaxID=1932789 RepID=UPI002DF92D77|nr:LuxR family transcriptional regulator [Jatrophihabitans sp.]
MLHGRERERARIGALLDAAWALTGGSLVLRGEPGVGKSSLLQDSVSRAEGAQILSTQGIESESPLAFAALHRLLRPAMAHAERLPVAQARALRRAFGETAEPVGDRFVIFVAVLSLLSELAEQSPVLCVIDDAHWLDDASAAALAFVARRLGPERIALLFAAREGDVRRFDGIGIPELVIGGLDAAAAGDLLDEYASTPVPPDVRDALVRQTDGNALALVELPKALSATQLSGRAPLPTPLPLTADVQRVFLERCRHLSTGAQTLLLVAATDDSTQSATVRAAAARLDVGADALDEAERSGLLTVSGVTVELRHPLVRSAIYQGATSSARSRAHAALAEVMVSDDDVDRRVWHRARAVDHPDEAVAADLDAAADRAARRGGYEAASAAAERAAELTADDTERARRLLVAATNAWLGGQMARASLLADDARRRTADPLLHAEIDRLRGRVELNVGSVAAAIRIWTNAARAVAPTDARKAREIAMQATAASTFVRPLERTDLDPGEVRGAAEADDRERCITGLLVGLHALLTGDLHRAVVPLSAALAAGHDLSETDLLTNMGIAAFHLGDDDAFRRSFTRLLARSRDDDAVALVLFALPRLALADLAGGHWVSAGDNATEALGLASSLGQASLTAMPLAQLALIAAQRGDPAYDELILQVDDVMSGPSTAGILGVLVEDVRQWARACHATLAERPGDALHHLERMQQPSLVRLAAFDRLEVAVRADRPARAATWLAEFARFADEVDSPRARVVVAFGRALLADAVAAEPHFVAALEHQAGAGPPFEAARIELAYGAFLRRARRRVDAREHLRAALSTFEDVRAGPWAERARRELRASGESARRRDESTATDLTAQERQVARLVADGLSNRDVAARLFLSPRTIDFHLRNVFTKTGVSSRGELGQLDLG